MVQARPLMDRLFDGDTVEAILAALDSDDSALAMAAATALRRKSPTSLKIALRQMQIGADLTFPQAMRTEYRIVSRVIAGREFIEGIRAVIIDKDNTPRWVPVDLGAVRPDAVDAFFAPLSGDELPVAAS
jgi:enoyl-CoA hydratase